MDTAAIMKTLLALTLLTLLITSPVAAAVEKVNNGDFSEGLTGWDTYQYTTTNSATITLSTPSELAMVEIYVPAGNEDAYVEVYQDVDITYVDELSFAVAGTTLYINGYGQVQVYLGNRLLTTIDSTTLSPDNLDSYRLDVSSYSGTYDIVFRFSVLSPQNAALDCYFWLTDVSAISSETKPSYVSSSVSPGVVTQAESVTASFRVIGGYPDTTFYISWGDGQQTQTTVSTQGTFTETFTHTYSSPGTYTVTGWARNGAGATNQYTVGTVEVVALDFSAYPTSGNPPLTVQFSAEGTNIVSVLWDFGDGATSTQQNPVHTYAASPNPYTVTLTGYTASGKTIQVPKENLISASAQYISWDKTTYEAGETAELTWSLRNPDFSTYSYTIQILPSDSQGNIGGSSSVITPISITAATGTQTIDTTGYAGYYTAAIFQSGTNVPIAISTTNIFTQATLTVNLAISGETYTNATTITLTKDGTVIRTNTTTTGQAQFTIPTGTYIVSATTTGYATQTATVNLLENTAITIDFVTGTSQSGTPSGSGSSYASTFITFRTLDELTGLPLTGVSVKAIGVRATSPLDWIANLFGSQWGEEILESEVSGYTDSYGAITFPMFLSVQYSITATTPDGKTKTLIMTPSSLQSEYIIEIPSTKQPDKTEAQAVLTSVTVGSAGNLTIKYQDTTLSTQSITYQIWQKPTYNETYTLVQSIPSVGNTETITYAFDEYKGTDIKITITAVTGQFGTIERTYYHTFAGMLIDLGLPDNVYPWICLLAAILIAGIATYLQAPTVALAIVFIEWVFYFIGWANAFGPVFFFTLILATLLSIAFYTSSRR